MTNYLSTIGLLLFAFFLNAQTPNTRAEIYNFNVGDEFHFVNDASMYQTITWIDNVLNKTVINSDSICYSIRRKKRAIKVNSNFTGVDTTFTLDTNQTCYGNLSNPIIVEIAKSDTIWNGGNYVGRNYDSAYVKTNNNLCVNQLNIKREGEESSLSGATITNLEYAPGLGSNKGSSYEYQIADLYHFNYRLDFWKKGNDSCGVSKQFLITSASNPSIFEINAIIKDHQIILASSLKLDKVRIYDLKGGLVINNTNPQHTININSVVPGVYILYVKTVEGQMAYQKFVYKK